MFLHNTINPTIQPSIPNSLIGKVHMHFICQLTKDEADIFSDAFTAVEKEMKITPAPSDNIYCIVIFTDKDKIELSRSSDAYGHFSPLITYYMHAMRPPYSNFVRYQKLLIAIEELCHCFWDIRDEEQVSYKVCDVIRHLGYHVDFREGQYVYKSFQGN